MKKFKPILRRARFFTTKAFLTVVIMISMTNKLLAQTPALEFASSGANTATNGPTLADQVITFQRNNDNPTGNTFTTQTPTKTVTFSLINQQRTSTASPGVGVMFGGGASSTTAGAAPYTIYPLLNAFGGANATHFRSVGGTATAGSEGISTSANYGVEIYPSTRPLYESNAPLPASGSSVIYQMADLVLTFNSPVSNPIVHFAGLGGAVVTGGSTPISTEFVLVTSGLTLTRLSGSTEFSVPSVTEIRNSASTFAGTTGAGGASGSVQVNGTNISSITFRVYLKAQGQGTILWAANSNSNPGDGFMVSVSLGESDLAVTKTVNNSTPTVGSSVTFTVLATNNGVSNNTGVTVQDLLPSGYTYTSHTATNGAGTYNTGTGLWTIGTLNSGSSQTLTITGTVLGTSNYTNTAQISTNSGIGDPDPSNNTSSVTPAIPCAISPSNPDSDGDGIADSCDLDDDNDGILDSVECGGGAVYNYSGFGIRTVGGTTANLIGFTGTNYTPVTLSTNILSGADANHLATDAARNRVLFANSGSQGSLFAYQFSTNTVVNIGSAFLSSLGVSSGGAGMYNGDYYIYDDTGTNEGLWRVTFNASGAASTLTKVASAPTASPDLGDMAISHSGMAYITANGNLYRIDLASLNLSTTAPASAWTSINTGSPITGSQLFFAANGDLIGSSSGNLVRVNPGTGANLGTVGSATNGYVWGDLSEAPTVGFSCGIDTDGDGIPNNLDLDSDNDGCPDSREGAGNFNPTNTASGTIASQTPNINFGTAVDTATGIPTAVGTGQGVGQSQNSSQNDCVDSDGDTIPDWEDLDDDNDGILDTDEILFCDQATAPNGTFPANTATPNTYQKQLLFFDWSGVTISNASPTASKSVIFNGVTYTAMISGYNSTGNFPMIGSDINTVGGFAQMIKNFYNVNGNTFKEIFYNTANQNTTNTLKVQVTATQGSVTYPVEVVVFDPEATNAANGPESLIYTTTGSNFSLLQKTGTGTINSSSITGEGTSKITYVDTENTNVNALYATNGYSPTIGITLNMPLAVGSRQGFGIAVRLACDIDGDGIPNNLDLDSDNDGCSDAIEGASTTITNLDLFNSSMPGGNSGATSGSYNQPVIQNLGNTVNTTSGSASYGVPTIAGSGQAVGTSQNSLVNSCFCYEDPALVAGATYPVKHGITILGRAGKVTTGTINTTSDWPMMRNSAYTALESKTKGFVITRNSSPETTIAIPVVGMMVFDTDENAGAGCMKIYTGSGAGEGWKCFNTQTCP